MENNVDGPLIKANSRLISLEEKVKDIESQINNAMKEGAHSWANALRGQLKRFNQTVVEQRKIVKELTEIKAKQGDLFQKPRK